MQTPSPRGYPKATMPEAPELLRSRPHWSFDVRAKRRMVAVERAIDKAIDRAVYRAMLADI